MMEEMNRSEEQTNDIGIYTIICDECKFEFSTNEVKIEEMILHRENQTKMRYFQCPECGKEYVIDVTDSELRKRISIYKRMVKKYRTMVNQKESETNLRLYLGRLNKIYSKNIRYEQELRRRWING